MATDLITPKRHPLGRLTVGLAEDHMLTSLLRYEYLTSRQVCRLLYSPGSLTYVQTKLKSLCDRGYCERLFLSRSSRKGSAVLVFTLARRGLNYLRNSGHEVPGRVRPSEQRDLSHWFLAHTLAVNSVLIALELVCRRYPQLLHVRTALHDRELKQHRGTAHGSNANKVVAIPDGWIDLRVGNAYRMCLALELDRGTEEQKKWRRKVAGLIEWSRGSYREQFGTASLTVAVLAMPGHARMQELMRWTEAELTARKEKQEGDLFRLTDLNPEMATPEELFLAPRWQAPFWNGDRTALVPGDLLHGP